MIDPELAQQATAIIAPFLPYLMNPAVSAGKDAAVKALGGKFVEAGWNRAAGIWKKIWPEAEKKPEVAQVIKEVAENTDDQDAKAVLSWQLKKVMANMPPDTIDEIRSIIADKGSETRITTSSNGGVAIGGNASGNIIIGGGYRHQSIGQQKQIDDTDFCIMQAIRDLGISTPNADKINALVNIDPEELGARIGVMHSNGLVRAEYGTYMPGVSLPNGIYAAGLTDQGRLALIQKNKKVRTVIP